MSATLLLVILFCRLNWNSRESLLPTAVIQNVGEVTSLTVSGDLLYWVEKDKAVLFWVTVSGSVREVSWTSLSSISSAADIFHLAISENNLAISDLNMACTKATCSHFCIPKDEPKNGFACACPSSMEVQSDGSCKGAMIQSGNELFWGNLDWKDRVENRFEAFIREASKAMPGTMD